MEQESIAVKSETPNPKKAQTVFNPDDPFANDSPMDPTQIQMGSLMILELSSDGGKTWNQFGVSKLHKFPGALEADMPRYQPMTIHPDLVVLARIIINGNKYAQVWEGKTMQTMVTDDLLRFRIYSSTGN